MRTITWLTLAMIAPASRGFAQSAKYVILTPADADKMLNGVFSKAPRDSSLAAFHIVLRYLPSLTPEEQIVLAYQGPDSTTSVVYETLKTPLIKALRESDDLATLGARAGLATARVSVEGDRMRTWLEGLTRSMASSLPMIRREIMPDNKEQGVDIHVDGTNYLINISSLENEISLNVVGPELGSGAHDLALIEYLLQIRSEVRALVGNAEKCMRSWLASMTSLRWNSRSFRRTEGDRVRRDKPAHCRG